MDLYIDMPNSSDLVDTKFDDWDLAKWVKDEEIVRDIKSAMEEMYYLGSIHGKLKPEIFEEAIEFVERYP